MSLLWGEPGPKMNELLTELGFVSSSPMRQRFYNDLRKYHENPNHLHRRDLTKSGGNEEHAKFLRHYGNRYFGPENRSHLLHNAPIYDGGASDDEYV